MKFLFFLAFIIFLYSCSSQDAPQKNFNIVEFTGRDTASFSVKPIIYRIKVPKDWIRQTPLDTESLIDTTKALIEFFIQDHEEKIRIVIHNFPSDKIDQRIPPMAHISRWKKQFQSFDQTQPFILPQSFGGYSGFLLEATGEMQGKSAISMMAWTLLLAPEHYQALSRPTSQIMMHRHRQMRADITIKATGPKQLMHKYREQIISVARSFQLIDDIP